MGWPLSRSTKAAASSALYFFAAGLARDQALGRQLVTMSHAEAGDEWTWHELRAVHNPSSSSTRGDGGALERGSLPLDLGLECSKRTWIGVSLEPS